jgi:hypothetical protein
MRRSPRLVPLLVVGLLALASVTPLAQQAAPPKPASTTLDFEYFKTRVQPIFLARREGHARCIACHTTASNMRLQAAPAADAMWSDEASRKNFDAVRRMVVPGSLKSRLLIHPLATEAGGDFFHNGGKQFASQDDREWTVLKDWVMGATSATAGRQ